MKVFRLVSGTTYKVVGHDGPHFLIPSKVDTFTTNIAVQPGDVLGVNDVNASSATPNACTFSAPGDSYNAAPGDANLGDGMSADFSIVEPDGQVNATAVVALKPSNAFSFGKVKDNKAKGAATLAVKVPGPGTLALTGKGVKAQRPARGATASKTVTAAGIVKLLIKAKGKAKRKLTKTGKAKVKVSVTYTPNGTSSGDVVGDPGTRSKRVRLIKRR